MLTRHGPNLDNCRSKHSVISNKRTRDRHQTLKERVQIHRADKAVTPICNSKVLPISDATEIQANLRAFSERAAGKDGQSQTLFEEICKKKKSYLLS